LARGGRRPIVYGQKTMDYLWHIVVMICLYAILAMSLNLVVGYTGLLSLCHAAFYGIGAYTASLLMVTAHWSFLPALGVSMGLVALLSLLVGVPSLRLKGDYFVLATLGFQVIVFSLLYNCTSLTRGPYGITDVPGPIVLGWRVDTPVRYALFTVVAAILCGVLLRGLVLSPFGRVLMAIREDETATAALGKNTFVLKLIAFALGAALAAAAGCMFASYAHFIDPTSFGTLESVFILSVLVAGGAGSLYGPVTGAVLLVVLPEALRFLPLSDAVAANMRQILYGLLLILLMRLRPQGILGQYRFD